MQPHPLADPEGPRTQQHHARDQVADRRESVRRSGRVFEIGALGIAVHEDAVVLGRVGDQAVERLRREVDEPDAVAGFLLDGYPRTVAQVEELDSMLADAGTLSGTALLGTQTLPNVVGVVVDPATREVDFKAVATLLLSSRVPRP